MEVKNLILIVLITMTFFLISNCSKKSESPTEPNNPSISGTVVCNGFVTNEDQIKIMTATDASSEKAFINSLVKYIIIYEPGTYTISDLEVGSVLYLHAIWEKKGEGFGGGGDKGSGQPNINPVTVTKEGVTGIDITIRPIIPDDILDSQLGTFVMEGNLANTPINFYISNGIGTTNNSVTELTIRDSTNFYGRFIEFNNAPNSLSVGIFDISNSNFDIVIEDDPDNIPSHTEVTGGEISIYEYKGLSIGDTVSAKYLFNTARGDVQGIFRVIIKLKGSF